MNDHLFDFAIGKVATITWSVISEHLTYFHSAAGTLLGLFLFIAIFNESLDIAMGRGFELDKKLILWLIIIALVVKYPLIGTSLYKTAQGMGGTLFSSYTELSETVDKEMQKLYEAKESQKPPKGAIKKVKFAIRNVPFTITMAIASFMIGLCLVIIAILIASGYVTLGLSILVGPIFIVFFMDPTFRSIGLKWVSNIISYFIMIPLYGFVLYVCVNVYVNSYVSAETFFIEPTSWKLLFVALLGPILCLGIVMHVPKLISGLMGAVSGSVAGLSGAGMAMSFAAKGMAGGKGKGKSGKGKKGK